MDSVLLDKQLLRQSCCNISILKLQEVHSCYKKIVESDVVLVVIIDWSLEHEIEEMQLTEADDSVIIELNDALPTQSFHPVNSRATCEHVGKRLGELQLERIALIERCLSENQQREKSIPEGTIEARLLRNTVGISARPRGEAKPQNEERPSDWYHMFLW
ncbi:hypothetical protein COOONC_03784 [Cooperia oncophora]